MAPPTGKEASPGTYLRGLPQANPTSDLSREIRRLRKHTANLQHTLLPTHAVGGSSSRSGAATYVWMSIYTNYKYTGHCIHTFIFFVIVVWYCGAYHVTCWVGGEKKSLFAFAIGNFFFLCHFGSRLCWKKSCHFCYSYSLFIIGEPLRCFIYFFMVLVGWTILE